MDISKVIDHFLKILTDYEIKTDCDEFFNECEDLREYLVNFDLIEASGSSIHNSPKAKIKDDHDEMNTQLNFILENA